MISLRRKSEATIRQTTALTAALGLLSAGAFAVEFNPAIDTGGGRSTSANYTMDSSIGGLGGISSAGAATDKYGYIGQLTEVTSLAATATPSRVNEGGASQLSCTAIMDDGTVTLLPTTNLTWGACAWPIRDLSLGGLVTTEHVYADTPVTLNCSYLGVAGSGQLLVLDTNADDYGSYAADGLPDSWQVQYFGLNNSKAAPSADADGTGQNNLFKYVAGLNPTNPASKFLLRIQRTPGRPGWKDIIFSPRYASRNYTVLYRTNLTSGTWIQLTGAGTNDLGLERTVTDLTATNGARFYRLAISAAVQTPGAPYLWVMRTPTNTVRVSWAVSDTSWQLEAATNLGTTGSVWAPRSFVTNEADCVYVEPSPAGNRFYRLRKP